MRRQAAVATTLDHGPLLERVIEEFSRFFTPTGRVKNVVSEAGQLVNSLGEREAELESELEALRNDVQESGRLTRRLRRVEESVPDLEATVVDRTKELRRIENFELRLESAENEMKAANLQLESKEASKAERDRLLNDLALAEQELAELEPQLDEATVADALEGVRRAEEDLSAARTTRAEAETDEEVRADDVGFLRRKSEIRDLEGRQASVATLRATEKEARDHLTGNTVTADVLACFQEAQLAVGQTQAALEAGGPEVEVRAFTDLEIKVNGKALEIARGSADKRPVIEETTVTIPGQLELVVSPGSSLEDLEAAVEDAAGAWRELCEAHSVDSIQKASAAHVTRANAERVLAGLEEQLAQALGDRTEPEIEARITNLAKKLATYEKRRQPELPRPESEAIARENLAKAHGALQDARKAFDQAENSLATVREYHDRISRDYGKIMIRFEAAEGRRHELETELAAARKVRADDELQRGR